MSADKPTATVDQLMAVLSQVAPTLEAGSSSIRKNELLNKSLTGAISGDENVELTKILNMETGLAAQMAKTYASESFQKSLGAIHADNLKPVFEASNSAQREATSILATAITNAQAEHQKFSRAQGQSTVLMARLLVEHDALLKSLVAGIEAIAKSPGPGPRGFTGYQPAVVPVPAPVAQPGAAPAGVAAQGALGGQQYPSLTKSQMLDHLGALYEEAASGKTLPNGINHVMLRDAMVHCDMNVRLNPAVEKTILERASK